MSAITLEQKACLEESWVILVDENRLLELILEFYKRLFQMAPEVRHYFPNDMNVMAEKLKKTLELVFDNLGDEEKLIPVLHELGRFHKYDIGVDNVYYSPVVKSLLLAIKAAMRDKFTEEMEASWKSFLIWLSRVMIAAPAKKNKSIAKFFKEMFGGIVFGGK